MAEYIYNPAESIKQGFQQTQSGIGNIFAQVIQQQQRDYTLAESAFQNIEALKKDVNIFGQKNITNKSNELLKQAGSAILKDGKLDYSKLGEIRQGISDIKDLKAGYDVGAKEYERMLQLGIANKDNLVSFEKFYKDLSAKMADENLVKNPQDLQRAMADTYSNNLDSFKMYGKSFLSANPYQKIAQDVKDPKTGALMRVQAELPTGWTIDAQGNKVPPAPKTMVVNGQTVTMDYADQELARLQSTNPDMLALMKKQAGFAGQTMSDKDLVKSFIDRIPTTTQATQVKNADELRGQKAAADKAVFDAAHQQEKFNAEMRTAKSQSDYYDAKANEKATGATAPADYAQANMYTDTVPLGKNQSVAVNGAALGKNMKLSLGNEQAIVTDVARSAKDGAIYAKVLVDSKGALIVDENKAQGAPQMWKKVSNPAIFKKTLDRTIQAGGFANKEKPYAQALINGVFNAPVETAPVSETMSDTDILKQMPKGYKSSPASFVAAFKKLNNIK